MSTATDSASRLKAFTRMSTGAFAGTVALTRLALRRDRIMITVWVYALTAVLLATAVSIQQLYPTQAQRDSLAHSMSANGSLRALYGPVFGSDTIGALTAWRMGSMGGALVGLMSILIVVRHTREEEETGRQELLASGAVGQRAPLTAALLTAAVADLLLALLIAAGMMVIGERAVGSVALGVALAGSGLMFAGIAAVTAQLTESARLAKGLAGAVLGLAFLLRATGDAASADASSPPVWISPLGWTENLRPFAADQWWVLGPVAAFTAAAVTAAHALVARRDTGAGFLPSRPGPAQAPSSLRGPLTLAWRLQRGTLYGWTAGFAVAGAVYGGVADAVAGLVEGNKQISDIVQRMGGQSGITDSFLASAMGFLGIVSAVYAVQSTLRLRSEETSQLAEPVLATAVGRVRWACGHLMFPAVGTLALLATGGLTAGLAFGATTGDIAGEIPRLTGAALTQAPAVWVTAGITVLLFGLLPKASAAAWSFLAAFLLLGQLGPVLQIPQAVMDLSPFSHLPKLPGGTLEAAPYAWLALVTAILAAAGLAGLRRRDITS